MSRKLVCDNCDAYILPESRYSKLTHLKLTPFTSNQGAESSIDLCLVCTAAVNNALTDARPRIAAKPVNGVGPRPGERPVNL